MPSTQVTSGPGQTADGQPPASGGRQPEPPSLPGPGWRGFLLILAFWTLFGAVMAASLLLGSVRQEATTVALIAFTFGGAYAWAALTLPLFRLTARFELPDDRRVSGYLALGLLGLAVALLVTTAVTTASYLLLPQLHQGYWVIFRYRVLTDLLGCFLVFAAGVARGYLYRYRARHQEANLLRAQLVETRLEVLRAQLNPHFLFNTLNAVAALVARDPKGVRRMIARLSDLLRYTLEETGEQEITVERELQMLRQYLEILEIRYQGRLETFVEADPEALRALVPNLVLQPLAENAMKHGVGQAGGYGRVEVAARREGEEVVLSVRDTGSRNHTGPLEGRRPGSRPGGFGLHHTRERLEQLYGRNFRLTLTPLPDGGTAAEIRLPFHTRAAGRPLPSRAATEMTSHA